MILRVLIADDEPLARQRLRQLLRAESDIHIVGECATGTETVQAIEKESPDVVLLDVRMPELDGFEVIQTLPQDRLPAFIFVTAHDRFALRAFEARALDFLLKPFDQDRLQEALQRARAAVKRGRNGHESSHLSKVLKALRGRAQSVKRIEVRSGGRIFFVHADLIDWIQSSDNYVELHVGSAVHLVRGTLGALEEQLRSERFARINRSLIVNADRIKELRTKSHGDYLVVLWDGQELCGSRNYRKGLLQLLGDAG